MPVLPVGEIELSYERGGNATGPPLLLIMGMSGTTLTWGRPFLELLGRDFETIVYDHRGVGASSRMEEPFTIAQLAEDALGLLAALEVNSTHVLGISMGGMVAQELALAHPERVRTLTLGCTYCGGEGSSLSAPEVGKRWVGAMMSGDPEIAVRTSWEINVSESFAENADAYAAFRADSLERPVARAVIGAQVQAIAGHDTLERLSRLTMPTLVVHGSEDQVIPAQNSPLIAARIAGARLEILDGVGHLFFRERPDYSAELMREHTATLSQPN